MNGLDITQLGSTAGVVAAIVLFLRAMNQESERRDDMHKEMSRSIKSLSTNVAENNKFLKNLNGKLEGALIEKVSEKLKKGL